MREDIDDEDDDDDVFDNFKCLYNDGPTNRSVVSLWTCEKGLKEREVLVGRCRNVLL